MAIDLADITAGDGSLGFVLQGEQAHDRSGTSVASAGDVNGDGFDDLIVGAPYADGPADGRDRAGDSYVIFGKAGGFGATIDLASITTGDGSLGFVLQGERAGDLSGISVASAGDVNGDGFDDLIVGAPTADGPADGRNLAGDSYVIFGKAGGFGATIDLASITTGDGSLGFVLQGERAYDRSGYSVASAGDVNGDGFADLIVGARYADGPADGRILAGDSYVIFGKAGGFAAAIDLASITTGDGSLGFVLQGEQAYDLSGFSVASAGDVTGDGFDDLIVGARDADGPADGRNDTGDSYVIFGHAGGFAATIDLASITTGDGSLGFVLQGEQAFDHSGFSVASAGDVNGDGFDDLIVGARYGDGPANGQPFAGDSYVIFGKAGGFGATLDLASITTGDGSLGFVLQGELEQDYSGWSVASAGDVNGDGFDDLIVGARGADGPADGRSYAGDSYVIFGKAGGFGATLDLAAIAAGTGGFIIHGEQAFDGSGWSVASAGDVNGDGFDDLIVGAHRADGPADGRTYAGDSYVIFGSATIGGSTGAVTHPGTAANDLLVGDGTANVMVGGRGDDTLIGGGGADSFHAGAGGDVILIGDTSFLLVDGGTGSDALILGSAALSLDLTDHTVASRVQGIEAIVLSSAGSHTLEIDGLGVRTGLGAVSGGKHILRVFGNAADTVLFANPKWGKTGSFSDGGTTFDRYEWGNGIAGIEQGVAAPGATIDGTAGNDTISVTQTVAGQPFATNRDDVINGHDGNDSINGARGADTMAGGDDDDTYFVDNAGDVVTEAANEGIDTVRATISYTLGSEVENLVLLGGAGFSGTGNALANSVVGNGGANLLAGLGGADSLDGGGGRDTASYAASAAAVTVNLATGTGQGGDAEGDTLVRIENLTGSGEHDVLTGNAAANVLSGGDGNDTIDGLGGNDTIDGGSGFDMLGGGGGNDVVAGGVGTDVLDGGTGVDAMAGGAGDDTYVVDHGGDAVSENADAGSDTVQSSISYALGSNVENLVLLGGQQIGGAGNGLDNALLGNGAANVLAGGDGADRLIGGGGKDMLTGGTGTDRFAFTFATQDIDRITDFEQGIDLLEISSAGFGGGLVAGFPPTVVNAANAATALQPGTDGYFIFDNAGPGLGRLYWDATGGSGADAVLFATVDGVASLGAGDFDIV